MMNQNNIPEIPAEKFKFVGVDAKLHDQKFDTKQVSYFRDAFRRFCKNKSSVVAAIIIIVLVLYAVFIPVFCETTYSRALTDTTYLTYTKLLPRNPICVNLGLHFWDGGSKTVLGEANYVYTKAIGVETGHDIITKEYGTTTDENGKSVLHSKIVPFLAQGAAVTTSRNDTDYVVTEYGIAWLRGLNIRQRVEELIKIAHPDFRDWLREEAEKNMIW